MRWTLVLAFALTVQVSFAQEPWHLWAHHEPLQLKQFLQTHHDSLHYFQTLMDVGVSVYSEENFHRGIHVMDLDQDGDMDAIYSGFSGAEIDFVEFWIATETGLDRSKWIMGELKEIWGAPNRFFVDVFQPGCCAALFEANLVHEVKVEKDQVIITEVRHEESAVGEVKPFWKWGESLSVVVNQTTYHLRASPEINTTDWILPHGDEPGNRICSYTTGNTGTALAQATDETGRIWWYVVMDPTSEHLYHRTGWMSSRFLEVRTYE